MPERSDAERIADSLERIADKLDRIADQMERASRSFVPYPVVEDPKPYVDRGPYTAPYPPPTERWRD